MKFSTSIFAFIAQCLQIYYVLTPLIYKCWTTLSQHIFQTMILWMKDTVYVSAGLNAVSMNLKCYCTEI